MCAQLEKCGYNEFRIFRAQRGCPETRRDLGGSYVSHCTAPDAVEPARRRIAKPAGRAGSHIQFNTNSQTGTCVCRLPRARMREREPL